jgi:hypothetical protein
MMLVGRIAKQEGPFWSADIDAIGAYTQGTSRKDAIVMLGALVETMIDRSDFKATVSEIAAVDDNAFDVLVTANEPAALAAQVLKYQREIHKLSLADVAKKLGAKSLNAYAAYEQGQREPSLSKFVELLAVVAPEMALTVQPREAGVAKRKSTKSAR